MHKNVTLSLPEPLLRKFRVFAAEEDRSMSGLMTDAIEKMLDTGAGYVKARNRFLERIRKAPARGIGDKIPWTRDELHER